MRGSVCHKLEPKVRFEVGNGQTNRWHPDVVNHDQTARSDEPRHVQQVGENRVELMIAVDKTQIKRFLALHQPRQRNLAIDLQELNYRLESSAAHQDKAGISPSTALEGINCNVPRPFPP